MRVLIVKNFSTSRSWGLWTIDSVRRHITRSKPSAVVNVCSAADGQDIPSPAEYDLIILTGDTFDLINCEPSPWVEGIMDLVYQVSKQRDGAKLLGFCWGHQAATFAHSGKLGVLEGGPRIGIEKVELNAKGEKLFGKDSLVSTRCTPPRFPVPTERLPLTAASFIQMLHKYHKRFVSVAAPGFSALASNNEILLSNNGKTLTLQGHPERTEAITADLVAGDDGTYISNVKKNIDVVLEDPGSPHDGLMVWDSLMHWVDSD